MPQTGNKINVNGVDIHYEKVGNGSHVLLLLPGALGSGRSDFSHQLDDNNWSENFTLIAWDPPGYGYSRPPERQWDNYFDTDAEMAANFMQTLGYTKYSVLGWSNGGCTALILAYRHPDAVQRLVLCSANAYVSDNERQHFRSDRDVSQWSDKDLQGFSDNYDRQLLRRLWPEWVDAFTAYDTICTRDQLKLIGQPCLVMHGKQDGQIEPKHADYLVENLSDARLVWFPNGSHGFHRNFVREFREIVSQFLLN